MLFTAICNLGTLTFWYSSRILPNNEEGIVYIFETNAGKSFTFFLNDGSASFVGEGDIHETKYNDFVTTFNASVSGLEDINFRIFDSFHIEHFFGTKPPDPFAFLMFFAFILTSEIFLLYYDYLIMHRYNSIIKAGARSSKIVESLFPVVVRDRLLNMFEASQPKKRSSIDVVKSLVKTPSIRLREFLKCSEEQEGTDNDLSMATSDPIAVMFPSTTIMFADIAGFTSWSSSRHPKEVFLLLEALFMELDAAAKKIGVFKVETIGDCYVAVAGLPEPQENHAVIMAQFALECQKKMSKVKTDLGESHGLGTEVLKLRIGLHSGPVTAGVLRSEKSRFQLFGDTMNTASRMESTGEAMKIQISEQTAELLEAAGKKAWCKTREGLVSVKGKGTMKTYWLCPYGHNKDATESMNEKKLSVKDSMDSSIHISEEVYNELEQQFRTKNRTTKPLHELGNNFVDDKKSVSYKKSKSLPITSNKNDEIYHVRESQFDARPLIRMIPRHINSIRTPAA